MYQTNVPSRDVFRFCKSFSAKPSIRLRRRLLNRIFDPFVLKMSDRISPKKIKPVETYKTWALLRDHSDLTTHKLPLQMVTIEYAITRSEHTHVGPEANLKLY